MAIKYSLLFDEDVGYRLRKFCLLLGEESSVVEENKGTSNIRERGREKKVLTVVLIPGSGP